MKSQLRLGLRRVGQHHLLKPEQVMNNWARKYAQDKLIRAFEMNCHPKHYDTGIQEPCYTMDYMTGVTTWNPGELPPVYRPQAFEHMTRLGNHYQEFKDMAWLGNHYQESN